MSARVCMLVRNDCRTDYRVLKEAASLARAGYVVTVVALNIYGPAETEVREGFRIVRVPVARARTRIGRGVNLLPRAIWRMAQAAADLQADVYHAHDSDAVLPAWLAVRRVAAGRLLYDAHEVGFITLRESVHSWGPLLGLLNWLWSLLTDQIVRRRVDAVITVNDVLADLQAAHYRIPRPVVVMNCPPRPTLPAARSTLLAEKIGVSPETPIVICSGMFSLERGDGPGLENLLRSAALLHRGVVVVMGNVGVHEQFAPLRGLVRSPELAGRAFTLPPVPPDQVAAHLASASIGVIPLQLRSLFRYASPNKLFEYIAAGLPVVYGDMPPVQAICAQYGCGLPCDPGSPTSIADVLNRLLDDADLYARMRNAALAAAQVYNWEAQEQALLGVYRRLLPPDQLATHSTP